MASLFSIPILPLIIFFLFITSTHSDSSTSLETPTPTLSSFEQESLYHILESIDSTFNWRLNYPDDLCYSGPRGVTCDYFTETNGVTSLHITELNFGYVSDYSSFPPCSSTSSFSPSLTSLTYLRKLFFYKCFTDVTTHVTLPGYFSNLSTSLEQLVFIENPALFGSLDGIISSFKNLKRLVFVGSNVTGEIPYGVGELSELEQVTLTRNEFYGKVPESLGKLKKLKVVDLSYNGFEGNVPDSFGEITELFKLDLSSNHFDGKIQMV
ncbi:hypothetical protein IFM89_017766 [Coptis chinensis]|uniref:Uncharacterized protein n=1 Tax=Coptis chinensis TaxID=261450 RepID=A0A835I4T3_9MAGN|nr:hypothetical protein IFM89_017766 [Coptis chinensis]